MAHRPANDSTPHLVLSCDQTRSAIRRLESRIDELEALDPQSISEDSQTLIALKAAISQTISDIFGHGSADWKIYEPAIDLDPGSLGRGYRAMGSRLNGDGNFRPDSPQYKADLSESITIGKERALGLLRQAVAGLNERLQGLPAEAKQQATQSIQSKKVFIVHGHDEAARETVARFIQNIGLEPVILHERLNKGRPIITKFREEAADAAFAVVLMTPDDQGAKAGADVNNPRARQNVVFELGFFIGAIGPEKVSALVKGKVEKPSDFDGVVYISMDHGHWKIDLAKEFRGAGIEIDFNRVVGS